MTFEELSSDELEMMVAGLGSLNLIEANASDTFLLRACLVDYLAAVAKNRIQASDVTAKEKRLREMRVRLARVRE